MTNRERVVAAISHRQPDTVPIDLSGTRDSSIVVEGYDRLKRHFGVKADNDICNRMMQVVNVDERILRALDVDTRAVFPGAPDRGAARELAPNRYMDPWGVERIRPEGSYYYDQVSFPLAGKITVSDIARHPWPDPDDPGIVRGIRDRLRWVRENTDCAAVLTLPAPIVHVSQYLRGYEDWYIDVATDTKMLEALFDAVGEVTLRMARNILTEAGRDVDVVICADDLGAQNSLQISHDDYARLIRPRHAKYIAQIHELSPAKVLFHSCGSLAAIIEDLIEIGVDVLNPVQTTAAGMDPAELKARYGERLAFWGAMDTQNVLPRGSVEDVKSMVEERIEQMGAGGGYVLASCHNLQPDVPVENVLAMFRHAREYVPSFAR